MSSTRIASQCFVLLLLAAMAKAFPSLQATPTPAANGRGSTSAASPASDGTNLKPADPAMLFQRGQDALAQGRLDEAERDFRQLLQLNPRAGGAYANLGVVYMRRKQWSKALEALQQAEHLMPQVAGIRLNIGLVYYRQNEFLKATPPFESVVRDQPDALQPRYLLGLFYFLSDGRKRPQPSNRSGRKNPGNCLTYTCFRTPPTGLARKNSTTAPPNNSSNSAMVQPNTACSSASII